MANNVGFDFASRTDTGRMRSGNEDAIALSPAHGIAILADGMGGYSAGEVASSIATTVLRECLEEGIARLRTHGPDLLNKRSRQFQQLMVDSVHRANLAILEAARAQPQYQGMGTTIVAAHLHRDKLTVAHVGDSRAYRWRRGELAQITRDHSFLQEQIDAGVISLESARLSEYKNLVTRAVGVSDQMDVEAHEHQVEPGDIYLLCSDGLSDMLDDEHIRKVLEQPGTDLQAICDALVDEANENGGRDNISVILIRIRAGNPESDGLLGRIFNWMT
ncbi:MAG: Stp1/IreP family PP2C-type Ser/Thr phosphatase [Noviherbaspirillum sp.]|nr:Stp1/IreP family PP2C-type Ser/Thr phosphatase [Noviherbaspirillum sp.]